TGFCVVHGICIQNFNCVSEPARESVRPFAKFIASHDAIASRLAPTVNLLNTNTVYDTKPCGSGLARDGDLAGDYV
ncbi:MAG: hypothetical protein ABWZ65_00115, partial [Pseudomonas mandelii]